MGTGDPKDPCEKRHPKPSFLHPVSLRAVIFRCSPCAVSFFRDGYCKTIPLGCFQHDFLHIPAHYVFNNTTTRQRNSEIRFFGFLRFLRIVPRCMEHGVEEVAVGEAGTF